MSANCALCVVSVDDCCEQEEHEFGFVCTRELGHADEHIACGEIDHDLARWNTPAPVPTRRTP